MNWFLFAAVSAGWVLGFWLLNKFVNWLECRVTWWFHTLEDSSWLVLRESSYDKQERLDRQLQEFRKKEDERHGE
jgi:hypothetical protein